MFVSMKRLSVSNKFGSSFHFILLFFVVMAFTGCAKIRHLPRLLRIKRYSENKEAQAAFISLQNENFKKISRSIEEGKISAYKNRAEILEVFGNPIFSRLQMVDSEEFDVWLYRPGADYFPKEKVYLYFDTNGDLKRWERVFSQERFKEGISSTKYKGGPG